MREAFSNLHAERSESCGKPVNNYHNRCSQCDKQYFRLLHMQMVGQKVIAWQS